MLFYYLIKAVQDGEEVESDLGISENPRVFDVDLAATKSYYESKYSKDEIEIRTG